MKKFLVLIACLCLVSSVYAAPYFSGGGSGGGTSIVYNTKDNLPGAPTAGDLAGINDGSTASDCTVGGGSNWNLCVYNGSAWVIQGDGTGGAGTGSVTTLESGDVQVGDADIVSLDFDATAFSTTESPDTEVNVALDVTPSTGDATLIVTEDAVQVKYDATLTEGISGLGIIDDGVNSEHYLADSIDNEHINWADIDNLGDEGAITVADTTDTTSFVALWESATGDLAAKSDLGLTYNATTGMLTATGLTGPLTGTASLATTLTITDNENTAENNAVIFTEAGDLDGGNLGLESDGTFYYTPSTGTVTATAFTGTASLATTVTITDDESTADDHEVAFTTDNLNLESDGTFIYNPSTGTVTATAFAGDLTGAVTGTASLATTVTITDDESTADDHEVAFTTDNLNLESDGTFIYNPSTGTVTATGFTGALTGNADTVTVADAANDTTTWVLLGTGATGSLAPATDASLTYNANTGELTATGFTGALTGNADTVSTNANLTGEVTSVGNATTIADSIAVSSWTLTTPTITSGAIYTDADISPDAAGELVYDNTVTGILDGAFAWYDDDAVRYFVDLATLPVDDDYVVAYDAAADGFYMKVDADTGGAPVWENVSNPTGDQTLTFDDGEETTFTSAQTAADQFNFIATGAFGDISIVKIDQNTGDASDGTMLEIATDDAQVDHLLLQFGASDYVTHKIVDAGTYTIDVTSDGTAGVTFPDPVTFSVATVLAADSIDAITEIAAALKSGSDGTIITGTAGTDTYVAVWNADGDLVDGAGVPYVVGGTDVADADMVDAHSHAADSIDALTEIAAALKSGADGTLVTGTAGTDTYTGVWNADGDIVDGYDPATKANLTSPIFLTSLEIPNGASGTTDATGEVFLDTDGPDADYTGPVVQISVNDATLGYLFTLTDAPAAADDNKIIKYDAATNLFSLEADSTGSALGTNLTSSTDDLLSDNGTILLGGTGGSNNLTLDLDFETSATVITATGGGGATTFDFGTVNLATDTLDVSDGNITNVGIIQADELEPDAVANGSLIVQGGQTATNTLKLQAYDVNGTAYADLITLTAHATSPTIAIASDGWNIDGSGAVTGVAIDADGAGNAISNIEDADIKASANINAAKIGADTSISNAEYGYLDGANATSGADFITEFETAKLTFNAASNADYINQPADDKFDILTDDGEGLMIDLSQGSNVVALLSGTGMGVTVLDVQITELQTDNLDVDGVVTLGDGGDNFSVASDGIDISAAGAISNATTIGSGAITSTGAVQGTTFVSAHTAPEIFFQDSTTSGEAKIIVSDAAGPDGVMDLQVDVAGTLTTYVQLDGVNETVDITPNVTMAGDLNITGTLTVTTFEQNAVANPQWEFNDSNAAGADAADEEAARINANMTQTTHDDVESDLWFSNYQGASPGNRTIVLLLDGSASSIEAENIINAEAGITSSNGTTTAGFIRLYEDEDEAGSNYAEIIAPVLASTYTLTLPTTDGNANEILKTDGNGGLSWTTAGTATAWDDITDPDNNNTKTITFDNAAEATTLSNAYDTAGSFFKIDNTDADLANNTYLLHLEYTVDGQANADFLKVSDNNGDVKLTIQEEGNLNTVGTVVATGGFFPQATDGAALGSDSLDFSDLWIADGGKIDFDSGDLTLTHSAELLTIAGGAFDVDGALTASTLGSDGDVDALGNFELGHATDTTIARASAGQITVEGQALYDADDVPGGELGGTFASFTIDDSVAVETWTLGGGTSFDDDAITNVGDAAVDSISADGATLEVGDADEETHVQADGLPDADDTYSCGMVLYLTAGDAVAQWDLVAMQADGKVDQANASMSQVIGFAVEETNDGWPAADTETIGVCLLGSGGVIRNDGWADHTASEIVYVVDAGGTDGLFDPADEIDLEDGDYWIAVGIMQEEDIIVFPAPAFFTDDGS